jgi:hypothetical protein
LSRSPRCPRKTKTLPHNGLLANAFCSRALRPVGPLRMSVVPAASQTRVPSDMPLATSLIAATRRRAHTPRPHRARRSRSAASHPRRKRAAERCFDLRPQRCVPLTEVAHFWQDAHRHKRRVRGPAGNAQRELRRYIEFPLPQIAFRWYKLLGCTPCSRAIATNDAPSRSVSSTIRRFSFGDEL